MSMMFKRNSLTTRIVIGKLIGLIVGIIGLVAVTISYPESSIMLRCGVLLWYLTVGMVIGMAGTITWHPVLHLPMPWWARSSIIGAWMNLVLILIAYDQINDMTQAMLPNTQISPFWFIAEGALIGLVIGYLATRIGGEGKDIVDTTQPQ